MSEKIQEFKKPNCPWHTGGKLDRVYRIGILTVFLVCIPMLGIAGEKEDQKEDQLLAQATDESGEEDELAYEDSSATGEEERKEGVEEIVITGSLIKRTNITTPTPTTILDSQSIAETGQVNLIDTLNELPSIMTGVSQQTANYSFGNAGLSQLDLRNMGTHRTLVLVDGRRPVGTPNDHNFLSFDLNSMPPQLIERVEVITGGASATYGSDAVAGVVNVITKKKFEGTEVTLNGGISSRGDTETTSLSFLSGTNLQDDRANAMIFFSFTEHKGLWQRDRDFLNRRYYFLKEDNWVAYDNIGWANFNLPGTTTWLPINENLERGEEWNYIIFNEDGSFRLFEWGENSDKENLVTDGGDVGDPGEFNRALVPLRVYNFGARYGLDITDTLRFNVGARYAQTESQDTIDAGFAYYGWGRDYVSIDNPYISDELRTILLGDPADPDDDVTSFGFIRTHREYGPRVTDIKRQFFAISLGLEGEIGEHFDWNVYYQAGGTTTNLYKRNDQLDFRFAQAVDAIRDPDTGEIVCRDEAARAQGCIPINVLVPGGISPEAVKYITTNHNSEYRSQQQIFTAVLTGDSGAWFELPGGPLGMAVGVEARQEKLDFKPSGIWQQAMGFYASEFQPIGNTINIGEAFTEVLIPVVNDVLLVDSFNIESAIRYADYNFGGSNLSFKIGSDWSPVKDVRFRTVYAQAVRAPGLSELFDPGSRGASSLDDPCDVDFIDLKPNRRKNCADLGAPTTYRQPNMTTLVYSSGNEDLGSETAKTWTAGMVVTPRWVPDLALIVDYWDIKMTDVIARFGSQNILDNCVDSPSINNPFCDLIDRDADTFDITEVRDTYVNADEWRLRGIDLELNYLMDLEDLLDLNEPFSLRLRAVVTRLIKSNYIEAPETRSEEDEEDDYVDKNDGEVGNPRWRGLLSATISYADFSFNWQTRYVGEQVTDVQIEPEEYDPYTAPSIFYHDIYMSYTIRDFPLEDQHLEIYAGINNLFDNPPPKHPDTSTGYYTYYDRVLRYFFAGAKMRL